MEEKNNLIELLKVILPLFLVLGCSMYIYIDSQGKSGGLSSLGPDGVEFYPINHKGDIGDKTNNSENVDKTDNGPELKRDSSARRKENPIIVDVDQGSVISDNNYSHTAYLLDDKGRILEGDIRVICDNCIEFKYNYQNTSGVLIMDYSMKNQSLLSQASLKLYLENTLIYETLIPVAQKKSKIIVSI